MSKDSETVSTSLSAVETEAIMHFSLIVRMCGCVNGDFSALKVYQALDGHDDTKRIHIRTAFKGLRIEGIVVLKKIGGQWELYCAASDIDFSFGEHVAFSYDKSAHTYHVTKFLGSSPQGSMDINLVTGALTQFADPLDVGG